MVPSSGLATTRRVLQPRLKRLKLPQGPRLQVREWGIGKEACLLLHGFGEGSYVWTDIVPALLPFRRVIAIDLRGHGDSDWDPGRDYSTRTHLDDVLYAVNALALDRFIVIGHSMGAAIGLHLTSLLQDRVRALVVLDYAPGSDSEADTQVFDLFRQSAREHDSVEEFTSWLESTRPIVSRDQLRWFAGEYLRASASGRFIPKSDPLLADCYEELPPSEQTLEAITCPVLVVRGGYSALVTPQDAQTLAKTFPRGELAVVPGAGHAVMVDNPTGCCSALVPFIQRVCSLR